MYSSKDTLLLIDGYDMLGVNTDLTFFKEALTEEDTPFGDEWEQHLYYNMQRADLSQEGFFDDASDSINEALNDKQGETRVLCVGFAGNETGKDFTGFEGMIEVAYARVASRATLHKANARYEGDGAVEEGLILHPLLERTADGDTKATPVQHGSQTSSGGTAYLQVSRLNLDGYDSVTIRVLERNGSTWDTLQEFVAVDSAPQAQRIEISGDIEQDLAVEWEFDGTGSDPSIQLFVGFVRH